MWSIKYVSQDGTSKTCRWKSKTSFHNASQTVNSFTPVTACRNLNYSSFNVSPRDITPNLKIQTKKTYTGKKVNSKIGKRTQGKLRIPPIKKGNIISSLSNLFLYDASSCFIFPTVENLVTYEKDFYSSFWFPRPPFLCFSKMNTYILILKMLE